MRREISKRQIIVYLVAAFALARVLQFIASYFSNQGNSIAFTGILAGTMFVPFIAVLIARIPLKGMGFGVQLEGKLKYIFFALWAPAVLSILGGLLFFAIFPDAFDPNLQTMRDLLEGYGALEEMEAKGLTVQLYLLISTVQAVTMAPFINMFVALGEEIGWRGALYPYLKRRLGVTKGRILGGVIWGSWHWPVMILAGYEYGKEYIGAPVLGLIVFCIATAVMGILLDYVYDKTGMIWLPSLMHGAINAFTVFVYLTKPEYADKAILGPAYIGLIGVIPMLAVAVMICVREKN